MNIKILPSLAAALVVTSLAHPAFAQSLGEHPAVLVARSWSSRGIDPNTFIVAHPAGVRWVNESPTAKEKATHEAAPRSVTLTSSKPCPNAAIGALPPSANTSSPARQRPDVPAGPYAR